MLKIKTKKKQNLWKKSSIFLIYMKIFSHFFFNVNTCMVDWILQQPKKQYLIKNQLINNNNNNFDNKKKSKNKIKRLFVVKISNRNINVGKLSIVRLLVSHTDWCYFCTCSQILMNLHRNANNAFCYFVVVVVLICSCIKIALNNHFR